MDKDTISYQKQPMAAMAAKLRGAKEKQYQVLQLKVVEQPENGESWYKLANCCRALGYLSKAEKAYRKAEKFGFDAGFSKYISQLLCPNSQISGDKNRFEYSPAPFRVWDNFLASEQLDKVWRIYQSHSANLAPSIIGPQGKEQVETAIRSSVYKSLGDLDQIHFFTDHLVEKLSECYQRFAMLPPEKEHLSIQLTSHCDGDFYGIHSDAGLTAPGRKLSYIYYFHKEPKVFQGGYLHLHDTDTENEKCGSSYTCIEPLNNRLVVFPSHFFHQVTTINMASGSLMINGRHSINGWHSDANLVAVDT